MRNVLFCYENSRNIKGRIILKASERFRYLIFFFCLKILPPPAFHCKIEQTTTAEIITAKIVAILGLN